MKLLARILVQQGRRCYRGLQACVCVCVCVYSETVSYHCAPNT